MRTALVLGGADSLWADVEGALTLGEYAGVVACNDAGVHWPGCLDAWVSLHPANFKMWAARRAKNGFEPHAALYTHNVAGDVPNLQAVKYMFPGQTRSGSSGLFALKVALVDLCFDQAVLCGVPLDNSGHFVRKETWAAFNTYRRAWQEVIPSIRPRVRSMSGWTREQLGGPDSIWLGV